YRMFTSRAEHRLLLRQDNADERLLKYAVRCSLLPKVQWEKMIERRRRINRAAVRLKRERIRAEDCNKILEGRGESHVQGPQTAARLLQRPRITIDMIGGSMAGPPLELDRGERAALETRVKYEGYIKRQRRMADRLLRLDRMPIPEGFSYDIKALSSEAREKLEQFRPVTLGKASRISGVRTSDLSIIMIFIDRMRRGDVRKGESGVRAEF
ncbi:MAG: tRNA uridine-5-carboxymethylaminomethyl(34) synthesis enzyme MnmG, partial [Candidatus Krumholzibacteria bacterium]|nr:tRNA uridine-5-carboxymethylaminomethyl(34) synthesis enzyme MnmG [Candidatus Krumholzibacteria bacterium]